MHIKTSHRLLWLKANISSEKIEVETIKIEEKAGLWKKEATKIKEKWSKISRKKRRIGLIRGLVKFREQLVK